MANKNPNPSTRYGAENGNKPGRKHTKDKLSQAFLKDLHEVWEKKGRSIIDALADGDGKAKASLAKIMAGLEPKQVELTRPTDGLDDDKLQQVINLLEQAKPKDEEQPVTLQ